MTDTLSNCAMPVAVVGMSAIYPGGSGLAGFWRTIVSGRDAITDVPASHWLIADYYDPDPAAPDKTYCKRGGFIDPVAFDPMQFGLPPNALPATDSAQLLALIAARQALDQAGRSGARIDPDRVSVVLGVASTTELVVHMGARLQRPVWRKALKLHGVSDDEADAICDDIAAQYAPWQESTFPGLLGNVVAGRIANRLNLGGSNFVTDAACASSLSALQVALHQLYLNEADMVLTGGVDALNDIMMYMCFSKTPAFSPTGDCRPFADAADGTIIGEGVGMLALKRLDDAERDGDPIHAVIRGIGSSSDGRASSVYAPRPEGQSKALRRAYQQAGYRCSTVELLEAHGTATKAGDLAEFSGLSAVFAETAGDEPARCALGSVKSQIGHTKAAAGAAGLIKAVLALQHATLPGTIKVERPNAALGIDRSSFYVNAQTRPWVRGADHPRRASVSSFGFGGSNFHVTLEEYRGVTRAKRLRVLPCELVLISAPSAPELAERCARLADQCGREDAIARIAYDSACSFDPAHEARAGLVASDARTLAGLASKLAASVVDGRWRALADPDIAVAIGPARTGKTAFLFPGQGSHYVGMGADLAMAFPDALAVWDRIADETEVSDLSSVVFPEPAFSDDARALQAQTLTAMENAQPALAATSLAHLAVLERLGVRASAYGGHSFGEVSALAAAGVLPRNRLVSVSRVRGALMTQAAGTAQGAMLAVAAGVEQVAALMAEAPELAGAVTLANDNAPLQVVLSGAMEAIGQVEALMKARRITAFRLPVASAFHSPIVASSCKPFARHLRDIAFGDGDGDSVVYANATAAPYDGDIGAMLADQLQRPVRFREMVARMADDGVTRFIEVGPGRILTGLVGQCLEGRAHLAVAMDDRKAGPLRGWSRALAALAADGVALDLVGLFDRYEPPQAAVSPPAHAVRVGGANLGKPDLSAKAPAAAPQVARQPAMTSPSVAAPAQATIAPLPPKPPEPPEPPEPLQTTLRVDNKDLSHEGWSVIDRIQAETVAQHRHYLDVMARSHEAFLDMSTQMLNSIMGAPSTSPSATMGASVFATAIAPPTISPDVLAPTPMPVVATASSPFQPSFVQAPSVEAPSVEATSVDAPSVQAPIAPLQPSREAPAAAILRIVADKTGYPLDMLQLDMEMEAELGIDSIKQVEILAAVQERFPAAPEIAPADLARMKTLRDVVNAISAYAVDAAAEREPTPSRAVSSEGRSETVLEIVAEKTGYPRDMLTLDMEMEAELGIDSIKQVEILSALQERWPDAPEVSASELSGLKTLRDVAAALDRAGSVGGAGSRREDPSALRAEPANARLSVSEVVMLERPATGFAVGGLSECGVVHVTNESSTFADEVVAALKERGIPAVAVETVPDGARAVISLAALAPVNTATQSLELHLRVLRSVQSVARSTGGGRLFVTVQSTGGSFGLGSGSSATIDNVLSGGVAGIVKTAAREWEDGAVKAVDMASLSARQLVDELVAGGPELEVALLDDGRRMVPCEHTIAAQDGGGLTLPEGGVVIVTGGARGVTARCAIALAKRTGVHLALLGRTEVDEGRDEFAGLESQSEIASESFARARDASKPISLAEARRRAAKVLAQREVKATLALAAHHDLEARYYRVDAADAAGVKAVVAEVRENFGAVVGVIHGAGVLADKRLADMTEDQFAAVFGPKVSGVEALLEATRDDDLRLVALFSSVAARTGNAGQGAYAAANQVLNAIAAREKARRGAACAVRAFGWGPWAGGMVDAALKQHFERSGVGLIDLDAGAAFFAETALGAGGPASIVVVAAGLAPLRRAQLDWTVSAGSLPPLLDHVVQGRIVMPIVIVLERILRAARAILEAPGVALEIRDLQVLAGVTLSVDTDEAIVLSLALEPKGRGWIATIRDQSHRARYRAGVEQRAPGAARLMIPMFDDGQTWKINLAEAYAGPLFHGARFAAVAALEGAGALGGAAVLKRSCDLGWPGQAWATDPAALDGSLQLGLLWAHASSRGTMLPQKIASFAQVRDLPPGAPLRARLQARPVSDKRVDFDVILEMLSGEPVAELAGVEFYALGAGASASP